MCQSRPAYRAGEGRTCISCLGLELDTIALEIRLPQEKLKLLKATLASWRGRKAAKKRELLSLVGTLMHASKAIRAGRAFTRRLIDLAKSVKRIDQFVRLSREARADIEWWHQFATNWNGTAMMVLAQTTRRQITLTSDASGNWGCGAFSGRRWFMVPWSGPISSKHIAVKELAPIFVAAAAWGSDWKGALVQVQCDNTAVVEVINKGTARDRDIMQLMRCLAFLAAKGDFYVVASHIKGVDNTLADALSRDNLELFRSLFPQAEQQAAACSALDLVLIQEPDWTCKDWIGQWSATYGSLHPESIWLSAKALQTILLSEQATPFPDLRANSLPVRGAPSRSRCQATIKGYLAGVRNLHITQPAHQRHVQARTGAKGHQVLSSQRPKHTLEVSKLKGVWYASRPGLAPPPDGAMLWAAAATCFFGFLRSGEITVPSEKGYDPGAHLSFGDVAVDSTAAPTTVRVRIKASKTDPFRAGVDVYLGHTGDPICPVAALLTYMAARGNGTGPLFKFSSGKPLTRDSFVRRHSTRQASTRPHTQDTASEVEQQRRQPARGSAMPPSR